MPWDLFWTLLLQGLILFLPTVITLFMLTYVVAGAASIFRAPASQEDDVRISELVYSTPDYDPTPDQDRGFAA